MVQFAPIQTYQGPQLDILGGIQKGQEIRATSEERGRKQEVRDILGKFSDPREREEALMSAGHTDAAQAVRKGRATQQTMDIQQAEEGRAEAEQAMADQENRTAITGRMAKMMAKSVEGVEDPEQRKEIWKMMLPGVESAIAEAGGVPKTMENIPWAALGEYSEEGLDALSRIGAMSDAIIGMKPGEDKRPTSIQEFEYGEEHPDFAKAQEEGAAYASRPAAAIQVADSLKEARESGDWRRYNELLGSQKMIDKSQELDEEGKIRLKEGVAEATKGLSFAEQTGKEEAELEHAYEIAEERSEGVAVGGATGAALNDYNDFVAAAPGLMKTGHELYKLAEIATYTGAGKGRDFFKRQFNVDVGSPAEARAEYGVKVKSEILPILKQTLGGNFSIEEGKWLLATLGDENLGPDEKQAQIKARMVGWGREGDRKAARAGLELPGTIDFKIYDDAPPFGIIEDGYMYVGGDPKNTDNWEVVE